MKFSIFGFIVLLIYPIFSLNWSVSGELTSHIICKPSNTIIKSIKIVNYSDSILSLNITQSDYAGKINGSPIFIEAGKLERSNSSWIHLQSNRVSILAKSSLDVLYSITIPNDNSLEGSYWSVLFLEENNIQTGNQQLYLKQRIAVQVITQIEDSGEIKVVFPKIELNKTKDEINIQIKNTGTCWIKGTLQIDLFNDGGEKCGRYSSEQIKLYPQSSQTLDLPTHNLKKGKYIAVCVVDCGENKIFGSQFTLEK